MPRGEAPVHVIDRYNHGWSGAGTVDGVYAATGYHEETLPRPRTYAELAATRGPLRPVVAMTDEEAARLRAALAQAGRRAVATLASALAEAFQQARTRSVDAAISGSYGYARRTLVAGAAHAWESHVLLDIVQLGQRLNHPDDGAQPDGQRVDLAARAEMLRLITDWVASTHRYVELAQNLAGCVSGYADDVAGDAGWVAIAEDWLDPATNHVDGRSCYHLLYSRSEHRDPDLL